MEIRSQEKKYEKKAILSNKFFSAPRALKNKRKTDRGICFFREVLGGGKCILKICIYPCVSTNIRNREQLGIKQVSLNPVIGFPSNACANAVRRRIYSL